MNKVYISLFGFLLVTLIAVSGIAQERSALWSKVDMFSRAVADNDRGRAADLAAELSNVDFSQEGFTHHEAGELRVGFAEALFEAGRLDHAGALLDAIAAGDKAALDLANSAEEKAFYRDVVIDRLERRIEMAQSSRDGNAEIKNLTDVHALKLEQLGIGHPELTPTTDQLLNHLRARADWKAGAGLGQSGVQDLRAARTIIMQSRAQPMTEMTEIEQFIRDMSIRTTNQLANGGDLDGAIIWLKNENAHWLAEYGYDGNLSFKNEIARLHQTRAALSRNSGNLDGAISDLRAARRLSNTPAVSRELAQVLLERARQYQRLGQHEKAYLDSTDAEKLVGDDPVLRPEANAIRERAYRAWKNIPDGQPFQYPIDPPQGYSEYISVPATTELITEQLPPFREVRVFYGTNRARKRDKYSGSLARNLEYGWAKVTVPESRKPGEIPRPFPGFRAKDSKHIILKRTTPYSGSSEFGRKLRASLLCADLFFFEDSRDPKCLATSSKPSELFVFIHGHNVSFKNASLRAAQLAVDLDMEHGATLFSWPTGKHALDYWSSRRKADQSDEKLLEYLQTILRESNAEQIHLIAHSMGNRVLLNALTELKKRNPDNGNPLFDQIIFASPDVDQSIFARSTRAIESLTKNMTLYASREDKALKLSSQINSEKRAGLAPPAPEIINATTKLVFVDTSEIKRKFLDLIDHADFTAGAFNDVRGVIWTAEKPENRCALQKAFQRSLAYWKAQTNKARCNMTAYGTEIVKSRLEKIRPIINRIADDQIPTRPIRPSSLTREIRNTRAR